MIYGRYANQQRIPGVVDLSVCQIVFFSDPANTFTEVSRTDQAPFKIIKKRGMAGVTKKAFYVFNAQFGESMLSAFEIDKENYVSVIKNDVFNILHSQDRSAAISKISGGMVNVFPEFNNLLCSVPH